MKNNTDEMKIENAFSILKRRSPDSNKGDYGLLTAVCGSSYFRGAAALSLEGALRSGVGIAALISTEKVIASVASKLNGCIYMPVKENGDQSISAESIPEILKTVARSDAVLVGCGMTNCNDTKSIVISLIEGCSCPLVLDADALNSLSGAPEYLQKAARMPIITPHVGEMSRLTGKSIADIKLRPKETALEFSKKYGCITILKDSTTFIASPDGRTAVNTEKSPGLAKGGSGDVLAGMAASFLAQGYAPFESAYCAVKLHSAASIKCTKRLSQYGMQPDDILYDLCKMFAKRKY